MKTICTPFATRVYELCVKIQHGKITTYGALAAALNSNPRITT